MSCGTARNHERTLPAIFQVHSLEVKPLGEHPDSIAQVKFHFMHKDLYWIVELTPALALQLVSDVERVYHLTARPVSGLPSPVSTPEGRSA